MALDQIVDIVDVVRRAKEEADGDREQAVALLVSWAEKDEQLFRQIMHSRLESRCRALVTSLNSNDRRAAWSQGADSLPRETFLPGRIDGQDILELRAGVLLSYNLPSGMVLAAAKERDLRDAAEYYGRREKAYRRNALFMQALLEHVKGPQTVGDVLGEEAIKELLVDASVKAKEPQS